MKKIALFVMFVVIGVAAFFAVRTGVRRPSVSTDYLLDADIATMDDYVIEYHRHNQDKYCFARYAPHGMYWYEICHDTLAACTAELSQDYYIVNTDACYHPEIVSGWCVSGIRTGKYIPYDFDDGSYELQYTICTRTLAECQEFLPYQSDDDPSTCTEQMVFVHETDAPHLTPAATKAEILQRKTQG